MFGEHMSDITPRLSLFYFIGCVLVQVLHRKLADSDRSSGRKLYKGPALTPTHPGTDNDGDKDEVSEKVVV